MTQPEILPVSIVIPTFQREQVLLDTVKCLLRQSCLPAEILLVDQSPEHEQKTTDQLSDWDRQGQIKWVRLPRPSIPVAMNTGLKIATGPIVLFLDDDIEAGRELITAHLECHANHGEASAVVGQVLQPGQEPISLANSFPRSGLRADLKFPFNCNESKWVSNVIACNFSVKRNLALGVGGFDENFSGVAFRFETDFARRLINSGGRVLFCPKATIRHLQFRSGGTRSEGSHLTSASARHGMGDYYFAFLHGRGVEGWLYSVVRLFREVGTRFHLRHPWWIPVKLLGEIRAIALARQMFRQGPRHVSADPAT